MASRVKRFSASERTAKVRALIPIMRMLCCMLLLTAAAQQAEARPRPGSPPPPQRGCRAGDPGAGAAGFGRARVVNRQVTKLSPTRGLLPVQPRPDSRYTSLDKTRIHYQSYGKGSEALVLIHGWTCNLDNWRDQIPDFAKRNRVIAIDLPGHGQSDKPELNYSMDLFARAVDAVLRDAGVKRAVLVGHSMGTPVARQFYRKYPDKTLAIVIVDGALRPFGDKKMMDGLLASFRGPNYKEAGAGMFAQMAGPNLSAEAQERIRTSFLNTPQHVIVGAMEGMADASIWGEDKINVPVLAIMAKSPFYPPGLEQSYHSIAPNMDFQMWEGVGHFVMMEKPKQFNDAVLAFLDKQALLKK